MSEPFPAPSPRRQVVPFEGDVVAVLPIDDLELFGTVLQTLLLQSAGAAGERLMASDKVREVVRFVASAPAAAESLRQGMRTGAQLEALLGPGMRSAAPVVDPDLATLPKLMTAKQISALAARYSVPCTPSHVRKCLESVDQVGQAKRYSVVDALAFVESRLS